MGCALPVMYAVWGRQSCCYMVGDACVRIGIWDPIAQAQRDGTLDFESLSHDDQSFIRRFKPPVVLAWARAMLDWPAIEPVDLCCPTLWLVGSEDKHAVASVKEYEKSLKESKVQVHIAEGLGHEQVFTEVDKVLATMLAFTRA